MVSKLTIDLNLIILGSPEAGKATTVGQLLSKIASKSPENFHKQAQALGKDHEDPAWILDNFKDQKETRGDSEEQQGSSLKITTAKNQFNIIEVSGHKNFLQNLISRLPGVDAALLVISAKTGEFEASITNDELFYHHALLAFALGAKNFIIAVNKIDSEDQTRFKEIQETISERLKKDINLDSSHFTFVPISALKGENITEKSSDLAWYKGPTLLQAFETINPPKSLAERPLRVPLQDVYKIGGIAGPVPVGRVESGTLKIGTEICIAPGDIKTTVVSFETNQGGITDEALPGDNMGFAVGEKVKKEDLHRGFVCGDLSDPPRETLSFEGYVYFTQDSEKIEKGRKIVIDCHTAHVACEVVEIKEKINKRDGSVVEKNPELLGPGDFALIKFVPTKPLCVEAFGEYAALGRFAMRGEQTQNIGIGIISSVEKKPSPSGAKGKK